MYINISENHSGNPYTHYIQIHVVALVYMRQLTVTDLFFNLTQFVVCVVLVGLGYILIECMESQLINDHPI